MSKFLDPLSPEQKCCMNNKVPSKCLEMCVVSRDSDSRSLINEDSILKYCNPFWDTIGRCRKAEPGIFLIFHSSCNCNILNNMAVLFEA